MTNRTRCLMRFFGGKAAFCHKLIPLFPPHAVYVEPFGGAASCLLNKQPSPVEVYTDLDGHLVCLFRVLADPDDFAEFWRRVCLLPYSRQVYADCCRMLEASSWDSEVERAVAVYMAHRQGFTGHAGGGWGYGRKAGGRSPRPFQQAARDLAAFHARLKGVYIEHGRALEVIPRWDTPETFFYLDPPYVPETRRSGEMRHEMSAANHQNLVDALLQLKGKAVLSGFPNPLYRPIEEAGWHTRAWRRRCLARGSTRQPRHATQTSRTEKVWANYDLPGRARP